MPLLNQMIILYRINRLIYKIEKSERFSLFCPHSVFIVNDKEKLQGLTDKKLTCWDLTLLLEKSQKIKQLKVSALIIRYCMLHKPENIRTKNKKHRHVRRNENFHIH